MANPRQSRYDLLVVGGGVIGLAVAWRLAGEGATVALVERGRLGEGASRVAAGMLAPLAEIEETVQGRRAVGLALAAAERWPQFAERLEREGGEPLGLRLEGTLSVARDDDEARELERQRSFRVALGLTVEPLSPSRARELEPALGPRLRGGLLLAGEGSVEPQRVVSALGRAAAAAGVSLFEGDQPKRLLWAGGRVVGAELAGAGEVGAEAVVVACGAWSGSLGFLKGLVEVPVRPVRGEILVLSSRSGEPAVGRNLRAGHVYLVPRLEGGLVVGATMEERGFDPLPRAGAVYELLKEAYELAPAVSELALAEVAVGFRPATPDNLPLVGPSGHPGLWLATGHFRNGILQAPLCAELLSGWLRGGGKSELAELCDPRRLLRGGATVKP